jgi:hypothetical protein
MAVESFLSFYTYYTLSFTLAFFLRRYAFVMVLIFGWQLLGYGWIVGGSASDSDYFFFLPLVAMGGAAIGYYVSTVLNLRRAIFIKHFDHYDLSVPIMFIVMVMTLCVLAIWETVGTFSAPAKYLVTFFAYVIMLPIFYLVTRRLVVWAFWDDATQLESYSDHAAAKFYVAWGTYLLTETLVFVIFEWALPYVWPFWWAVFAFGLHLVIFATMTMFIVHDVGEMPYKIIRNKMVAHLKSTRLNNLISVDHFTSADNFIGRALHASSAMEMELLGAMERGQPSVSAARSKTTRTGRPASASAGSSSFSAGAGVKMQSNPVP